MYPGLALPYKQCKSAWTSIQGGTGSSMNYFDPVERQWRQLWVAGGYSIDYTGGLNETGSMVCISKRTVKKNNG